MKFGVSAASSSSRLRPGCLCLTRQYVATLYFSSVCLHFVWYATSAHRSTGAKCGDLTGQRVWNEDSKSIELRRSRSPLSHVAFQDWHAAPVTLALASLYEHLPGGLKHNAHERALLLRYLGQPYPSLGAHGERNHPRPARLVDPEPEISLGHILTALYRLPDIVETEEHKKRLRKDGFHELQPSDLLCYSCLHRFVKSRLWIWWVSVKRGVLTSGKHHGFQLENCWCVVLRCSVALSGS